MVRGIVGHPELDSLDVLCFGKETFEQIVNSATDQFGSGPEGAVIEVEEADNGEGGEGVPSRKLTICALRDLSLSVPDVT